MTPESISFKMPTAGFVVVLPFASGALYHVDAAVFRMERARVRGTVFQFCRIGTGTRSSPQLSAAPHPSLHLLAFPNLE